MLLTELVPWVLLKTAEDRTSPGWLHRRLAVTAGGRVPPAPAPALRPCLHGQGPKPSLRGAGRLRTNDPHPRRLSRWDSDPVKNKAALISQGKESLPSLQTVNNTNIITLSDKQKGKENKATHGGPGMYILLLT